MSIAGDASMGSHISSDMEVDAGNNAHREGKMRSEVVLAQSAEQKVSLLQHLPVEVLQVLRNTGTFILHAGICV